MQTRRELLTQMTLAGLASLAPSFSARAAEKYSVSIINTYSNQTKAMQALLQSKGWLEEFGVSATTENIADGTKVMGALLSGSSDICIFSGFGQALAAVEKGGGVKVVAASSLSPSQAVYAKKPEIRQVKDLEGKTIGVGSLGALLHQYITVLLEKKGVDPAKVTFVNVGSSADVFRAVVAGVVDAGPALYDVFEQQDRYGIHALSDGKLWDELPEFLSQAAFASNTAIRGKREGLVRTLAAYGKLYRYLSTPESHDDYLKARREGVGGDPKVSDEAAASECNFFQRYHNLPQDLALKQSQLDYIQNINLRFGLQKRSMPFDEATDGSIARDAMKLIG